MFTLRRWWDKNYVKLAGFGTAIGGTCLLLQTQNDLVFETYHYLSQPFQSNTGQIDYLRTAQVEQLQNQVKELTIQNQQIKALTSYTTAVPMKGVLAPIVLRSADNWWQQVTIGKGSLDGIAINHIVMGTGGIVGRVVSVSSHTSRVLLASDPNSQIGISIGQTRNMGMLQGTRGNQAVVKIFEKRPNIKAGDVVSTSAVSQLFPTGLAVGRVVELNLNKSPEPEAIVEFTAPFAILEWVTVHPHNPGAIEPTPVAPASAKPIDIAPGKASVKQKTPAKLS